MNWSLIGRTGVGAFRRQSFYKRILELSQPQVRSWASDSEADESGFIFQNRNLIYYPS